MRTEVTRDQESELAPNAGAVCGRVLQGLAWGEVFVCLGIHGFWVLIKSSPLGAETAWGGAVVAGWPFALALAAALLMGLRGFRAAMLQLEWLLHLSACACNLVLLAYLTLRDPFEPWLPYSWPICLWAAGLGFALLANLCVHERRLLQATPAPAWQAAALGVVLWTALLFLVSGMTWPAYFWTASIVLHAVMATWSVWETSRQGLRTIARPRLASRAAAGTEGLVLIAVMLLAQMCTVFTRGLSGTLELMYVAFLGDYTSPVFFAGAALLLVAARFRFVPVTHALVVAAVVLGGMKTGWPVPLAMGYGLAALFRATGRQGVLGYAISAAVMFAAWFLSLLGFGLASTIVEYDLGSDFVKQVIAALRIAAPVLFALWLVLLWWNARHARTTEPLAGAEEAPRIPGWASALVYGLLVLLALCPTAVVTMAGGWYPKPIGRAARVSIEEPCGICHAGYSESDEEYQLLDDLGVRMMRVDFHWSRIQPAPDHWDFSRWDSYLDAAERNGQKVLALLDFDNNAVEASPVGRERDVYIAPEDIPLFLEYVRRTVERYKDRVYAWEIWNEADMARFWQGTEEEFYALAKQTAETVRATAPEVRLLGTAMTGPMGIWTTPMIEGMHASGALKQVDHPVFHLYVPDPRTYYIEFSKILAAARKHGHPGAPWITETGDPDGGVYPWRATSALLAEHVIKSHTIATSLGIEKVVWYCLRDSSLASQQKSPGNSEAFFGLVASDGQWKPAAHAYRLFSTHCSHSEIRGDRVQLRGGLDARQLRATLYQRENGESALVLWFEPMLRPGARARVTLDLGETDGIPMIHDIGSSYSKALLDGLVDVTERPVFITFKAKDAETDVLLTVDSSPADGLWLLFLAGLLTCSFCVCWRLLRTRTAEAALYAPTRQ